jgi:protein-disulfide isomerase
MATTRHTSKPPKVKAPHEKRSSPPSRQSIVIALGIAIVAATALVAFALIARKDSSPAPVTTQATNLEGVPQSVRVLGSPSARVEILEFSDAQCPGCRYYALDVLPTIVREFVRPGKVKIGYHAYPFIGTDSVRGARFLLAASLQNKAWQLHDALYRSQGAENSGWLTDDLVRRVGSEIPGLDVDRLFRDANSQEITAMGNADLRQAKAFNVRGTPTLFVKVGNAAPYELSSTTPLNLDQMRAALDDALRS